jgi:hypothetical protein
LYTPPTGNVKASSTTYVTITATSDSTATVTFPMTVFPSDAIRMTIGGKAGSISSPVIPYDSLDNYGPDTNGKFWAQTPIGTVPGWYAKDDNSAPQASWPVTSDVGLYYTQRHATSDAAWSAIVPNGNYTLTLKMGNSDANQIVHSSVTIDSQGSTILSTATAIIAGNATYTPTDHTASIQVTNNSFYFAIREVFNSNFPFLSAWSLVYNSGLSRPLRGTGSMKGTGKVQ